MHKLDLSDQEKSPVSTKSESGSAQTTTEKNVKKQNQVESQNPATTKTSTEPKTAAKIQVDQTTALDNNQTSRTKVHSLNKKDMAKKSPKGLIIGAIIAIVAGIGTGYGSFQLYADSTGIPTDGNIKKVAEEGSQIQNGDVFGSADTSTFKDSARGYLEEGGLDGEGTHSLIRPGGPAQTVYLTSTVTDLSKLEGMEVEVWGETFQGQKAGWLMDVGRVEVVNTQGEKPTE